MEKCLLDSLNHFGISGNFIGRKTGPFVTVYIFKPENGIRLTTITARNQDIALKLKTNSINIEPMASHGAIGFQIPNINKKTIRFSEIALIEKFLTNTMQLPIILGHSIFSEPMVEDLTHMPHLLIAGSTGSGKSVGIHSFICSNKPF